MNKKLSRSLAQGIVINIIYIAVLLTIALFVRRQWPEDWYYWIPIGLAIGCCLTIGTLIASAVMFKRLNHAIEETKQELKSTSASLDLEDDDEQDNDDEEIEENSVEAIIRPLLEEAEAAQKQDLMRAQAIYQDIVTKIDQCRANEEDTAYAERLLVWDLEKYAEKQTKTPTTNEKLEQGLHTLDIGFKYAFDLIRDLDYEDDERDAFQFIDVWEVKATLLDKLGREEEAYVLVDDLLDFDDEPYDQKTIFKLSQTEAFQAWRKQQTARLNDQSRALLHKAERIISGIPKRIIPTSVDTSNPGVRYEVVSLRDAIKQYDFMNACYRDDATTLIIHGDFYTKDPIDDDWARTKAQAQQLDDADAVEGVVFTDNLYIDNAIEDGEGMLLLVMKNLYVERSLLSNDGQITIKGDCHARLGIQGEYNDGCLDIEGNVYSPYLIANDHAMPREADQEFIYIEGGYETEQLHIEIGRAPDGDSGWGWTYFKHSYRLLNPKVWNDDDEFCPHVFFQLVEKGENPFICESDVD